MPARPLECQSASVGEITRDVAYGTIKYGRCVYGAGNDAYVVDDQVVVLAWDEEEGPLNSKPRHGESRQL
jgi:hypothetical protein